MTFRPGMLLGTKSGFVVLLQPGSVLISMAHVATKGHKDAQNLNHHLWQDWYLRAVCCHSHTDLSSCTAIQGHGVIWAGAAAKGHVWVLGPASVLMSVVPVTTEDSEDRAAPHWLQHWGEQSCPPTAVVLGRVGPALCLGSTIELILLVGVGMSQP